MNRLRRLALLCLELRRQFGGPCGVRKRYCGPAGPIRLRSYSRANADFCTVHISFVLVVEPHPHEQRLAAWNTLWDPEVKSLSMRRADGPSVRAITKEGSCCLPRDATVHRETHLAAAAVMSRARCIWRVGEVGELEVSILAGCPDYLWLFPLEPI
jgi:hypothetical protein